MRTLSAMTIGRSLLVAVLSAAVVLGSVTSGAAGQTTHHRRIGAVALVELRAVLLTNSDSLGDPNPTHLRAVATTSDAARVVDPVPIRGPRPSSVVVDVACERGIFLTDGPGLESLCVVVPANAPLGDGAEVI
jgi:hypothetical protein